MRTRSESKIRGETPDHTQQEKSDRNVINAAKSSYIENPHRSKHTVGKLQNKDFIKKSASITENPISGLNVSDETGADADCRVADSELGGENVKFEEYYVDVQDTRLKQEKQSCEEDDKTLHYCDTWIKNVDCASKVACAFNDAGSEGGLYTGTSNSEFMSASGGLTWQYSGDILSFGEGRSYIYGSLRDESGACYPKNFITKFYIKDKANVSEFRIIRIYENNLLNITVNGQLIRDGVNLGKGNCWHNAGKTDWENWEYDLKPLLVEGWNVMNIDLKYTKGGHAAIQIKAKQYCCKEWNDKWEGNCP